MNLGKISPDLYPILFRSIKDPLNILDLDFRILWANEARARIHQRSVAEMVGKFCYEMFQRRTEPCPECPVKVVFNSGKVCVMERWVDLPDGSRRWGEVRAYPVFNARGDVAYAIEIAIDITEKKSDSENQRRYFKSLERTVKEITQKEVRNLRRHKGKKVAPNLTKREIEVLRLMSKGFSNKEIAELLSISSHTVKSHIIHIFDKLDLRDRTQAVLWAAQKRLI